MKKNRSIFIQCQCYGEGISVDYDADDNYYYFAYWSRGLTNRCLGWKEKLRHCWNIIKTGKPFNDEVVLNEDDVKKLADFLSQ